MPGLSEQCEARGLAGTGGQCGIAQTTAATGGGFEAGAGADQVGQQSTVFVEDHGAVGNLDFQVRTGSAVSVVAHPLLAGWCGDMRPEMKVEQGVHLRVDNEDDAAAAAAVTAVGTAERLEFLAVNRGAAVAAGTRSCVYDHPIDESRHRASP